MIAIVYPSSNLRTRIEHSAARTHFLCHSYTDYVLSIAAICFTLLSLHLLIVLLTSRFPMNVSDGGIEKL
jgi:hypothetical protein